MILAGDIGGTNTRLGYFEDDRGRPKPVAAEVYSSAGSGTFEEIVYEVQRAPRNPESLEERKSNDSKDCLAH